MKTTIAVGTLIIGAASLHAQTPIQLSLTPDIALFPRDTTVHGLSLNIWGENPQYSLHVGLINGATGDSGGFSWGIANYAESFKGVMFGCVNISNDQFMGWQQGWVNISKGDFNGFQSGIVNISENVTGFQLGVANYAERLNGVQIGLVNIAKNNPWFNELPDKFATGFPVLNWSF
jgi:hypothetical protein